MEEEPPPNNTTQKIKNKYKAHEKLKNRHTTQNVPSNIETNSDFAKSSHNSTFFVFLYYRSQRYELGVGEESPPTTTQETQNKNKACQTFENMHTTKKFPNKN